MWQHKWALWSGFLGATASCFVKMGVDNSSPLLRFVETHSPNWLADLDETLLRVIHAVLGELMVQYRINLMLLWKTFRTNIIEEVGLTLHLFEVDYGQLFLVLPLRILCVAAMLITNVYMIASFLKGIQDSGSVGGTSLSTAANFVSSAFYGKLLWGESMNGRWFVGFVCVLAGVLIISSETTEQETMTAMPKETKQNKNMVAIDTSHVDIRTRIKNLERRTTANPSPRPVTPPPPLEIYTKTKNAKGTKGKVASLKASFLDKNNNKTKENLPQKTPTNNITSTTKKFRKITPSPEKIRIPFQPKLCEPSSPVRRSKNRLKPESALKQYYNFGNHSLSSPSSFSLTDRSFVNECSLCDGPLFDKSSGKAKDGVADLSLNTCFHLFHSRCLKHAGKEYGNACPICEKPLAMWTASKQAAQFPGFWLERVENYLRTVTIDGKCLPASNIREHFSQVNDLAEEQKLYIQDDPMGMDRGLQAALEWGGYIDCNNVPKGHVGFSKALRTRGIWKYDRKKDDVWFWEWGSVHPRQRCAQCLLRGKLPVECAITRGSSEAAFYCSDLCQKRDKQRHKQTCELWQKHGPKQ
mmetsp:Transcript_11612/g.23944  ORF Transcript_11612/g.23944 Transcript_11612/m.23944 type:complete len:583 (-) Transcript_11612:10-1758(-)